MCINNGSKIMACEINVNKKMKSNNVKMTIFG